MLIGMPDTARNNVTNSAGMFVLNRLRVFLEELGHEIMLINHRRPDVNAAAACDFVMWTENCPLLPPECNVVRWCLNRPGWQNGPRDYRPSEMVRFWIEDYAVPAERFPAPALFWLGCIDPELFHAGEPKSGTAYWLNRETGAFNAHRGRLPAGCRRLSMDCTQAEHAAALRRAETVYALEGSAVTSEAILCGCNVFLLLPDGTWEPQEYRLEVARRFVMDRAAELDRVRQLVADAEAHFGIQQSTVAGP